MKLIADKWCVPNFVTEASHGGQLGSDPVSIDYLPRNKRLGSVQAYRKNCTLLWDLELDKKRFYYELLRTWYMIL